MKIMHAPTLLVVFCSCACALNVQKVFLQKSKPTKQNFSVEHLQQFDKTWQQDQKNRRDAKLGLKADTSAERFKRLKKPDASAKKVAVPKKSDASAKKLEAHKEIEAALKKQRAKQTTDQADGPLHSNTSQLITDQGASPTHFNISSPPWYLDPLHGYWRNQGFEVSNAGGMHPIPGDMFNGKLQKPSEEHRVIDIVRELMHKHNIEINYVLDGPGYMVEHAMPLLHVLPGRYWTLEGSFYPASASVPSSIYLNYASGAALARSVQANDRALILTWAYQDNEMGDVAVNEKIVMMPHGDDEDLQWHQANELDPLKILQRPFQDMAYSNYMITNKYAFPTNVSEWLSSELDRTFAGVPCHQLGQCQGTVLISIPGPSRATKDTEKRAICKLPDDVWQRLVAKGWLLMVTFHPTCDKFGLTTDNLPSFVYVHDSMMGLGIKDLLAKSTVLVTSSSGLLSMVSGAFIDKPVVRISPSILKLPALVRSVWNSDMGVIHPAFDNALASAVQRAVVQMEAGTTSRQNVLVARKDYQWRYTWQIDGFEEYRNTLALLSLVVPDQEDLMLLRDAVKNLTKVGLRPLGLYHASYDEGMLSWTYPEKVAARKLEARNQQVWKHLQKVQ